MENFTFDSNEPSRTKNNETTEKNARERISVEKALEIQKKLVQYMVPEKLQPYVTYEDDDIILTQLTMRWLNKYVTGDFNGFSEYCQTHSGDGFIEKVNNDQLTDSDLESLRNFLEQSRQGELFFTEEELNEFMIQNGLNHQS